MADQQAGWYPDPSGDTTKLRYWNGTQWTNDLTDAQQVEAPSGQTETPVPAPAQPVQAAQPAQPAQQAQPAQPQVVVQETTYTNPSGQQTTVDQVYAQGAPQQINGLAIASLICGITGLCLFFPSIAAIITGVMAKKKPTNKGMATAGLVLGIVGIVGWVLYIVIVGVLVGMNY